MDFFSSGFFWFLEGICFCLFFIGFRIWLQDKNIPMLFRKWLILFLWIFFSVFTIAFITTSIGENELTAAFKGGIFFGIITVITGVGVWRWILSANNVVK